MLRIESLPLPKCIPQNEMHVFPAAFTGNTLWFIFFIIPQFSTGFNSRKCAATNINFHDSLPWKGRGTAVRRWRGFFVKSFYDVFGMSGNPSVSATHCQLPFQGSLSCQTSQFCTILIIFLKINFCRKRISIFRGTQKSCAHLSCTAFST